MMSAPSQHVPASCLNQNGRSGGPDQILHHYCTTGAHEPNWFRRQ